MGTLRLLGREPDKKFLSHAARAPTVEAGLSGVPRALSESKTAGRSEPTARGELYCEFSLFSLQFPLPLLLFSQSFPPRGAGD